MNTDLGALARRAVDLGTLDPADLALLPGIAASDDVHALHELLEGLAGPEPQDCGRCAFRRRPGASDYCSHPGADGPRVYALLSQLPADNGRACRRFEPDQQGGQQP